ncbi:MAG: IS607 family transposase [Romboutsia timonensis]|uniref:IS607 family transposase n=1 Tax=Romboutsia timonensis TaxID=1776391 RepID=UPI002A74FB5B|nr:IS607 family transposase [Romboutsia timonensis]MDY2882264.1 IS607 family transposase [Romboutsia timonensis]
MENNKWLSPKKAAEIAGVNEDTIRRWDAEGKIKCIRTEGGHRRCDRDSLMKYLYKTDKVIPEKVTLIYARVSTRNRLNDLERQKERLELYCAAKGWNYKIVTDIGSGLNYKKKGLLDLIRLIETEQVERLVLNYKDRLLRFGSEIIFEICKYHDVEVVVVSEEDSKSYEEELVEDVLSIITVFSSKLYGSRSHKNKSIVEKNKELFKK